MITVRRAESDADLEAWIHVRRRVLPNEPAATIERMRAAESPDRLLLLAELDGELAGSGIADRSQTGGGFIAPRIVPEQRRRGSGTAVLRDLLDHLLRRGFATARADVDDDGALAFASRHGFDEVDRQVEQVRAVGLEEPPGPPYPGVELVTIAERPELLERAYPLAQQGYADMVLATGPAEVTLDEWLRDEATLPHGSFVALADGRIVGYAGLLSWHDDDTRAENGLTVVDRGWRGRGLAPLLKRRQLAWVSANGLRELVTWTQLGNEAMQRVNERLGYVTRTTSRTMRRELP